MNKNIISYLFILILLSTPGKAGSQSVQPDVTSYNLAIEPDINKGFIKGSVTINFKINKDIDSVIFNSGNLTIEKVTGKDITSYKTINQNLIVYLSKRDRIQNQIVVDYTGYPKKGLIFDKENSQAYTSFFTSHWMVCNDSPGDKALLYSIICLN